MCVVVVVVFVCQIDVCAYLLSVKLNLLIHKVNI